MQESGQPVLDAYATIAAMHAEGLRFLSAPVLAEYLGMSPSDLQKRVIRPLADEALAAGGGRFLLCRHKAIAEASVAVLRETNLFGDISSVFVDLSRAAITTRQEGNFVPDLAGWNYRLPEHFIENGDVITAVAASENMLAVDQSDTYMRVKLSKIYREAGQPEKSVLLFRNFSGDLERSSWNEWAVGEMRCNNVHYSAILATISICDILGIQQVSREQALIGLTTIVTSVERLYRQLEDPSYLPIIVAVAKMALTCMGNESDPQKMSRANSMAETLRDAKLAGALDVPLSEGVVSLKSFIASLLLQVDFNSLSKGRVPRSAIGSFEGLSVLLARQPVRPSP